MTSHGLEANLLPLELVAAGGYGLLQGHVARRHPLCANAVEGVDAIAVFQGPNAYISPRWYVNGQRSGRLAPSWERFLSQQRIEAYRRSVVHEMEREASGIARDVATIMVP